MHCYTDKQIAQKLAIGSNQFSTFIEAVTNAEGKYWESNCLLSKADQDRLFNTLFRAKEVQEEIDARLDELNLEEVFVFPHSDAPKTMEGPRLWEWHVASLAKQAAVTCCALLDRTGEPGREGRVGICMGRTLAALVDAIEERTKEPERRNDKRRTIFIPLWGDCGFHFPSGQGERWTPNETLASRLVERLNEAWNRPTAKAPRPLTLDSVPVFCPTNMDIHAFLPVLEFHSRAEVSDYSTIFGSDWTKCFIDRANGGEKWQSESGGPASDLDCILMSVGSTEAPERLWFEDFWKYSKINLKELGVVGDIGGLWVPEDKNASNDYLSQVKNLWTCLDESVVLKCAEKGRRKRKPTIGTLAIAAGRERAQPIVKACVDHKWLNRILIDVECAEGILNLLDPGRIKRAAKPPLPPPRA